MGIWFRGQGGVDISNYQQVSGGYIYSRGRGVSISRLSTGKWWVYGSGGRGGSVSVVYQQVSGGYIVGGGGVSISNYQQVSGGYIYSWGGGVSIS